MAISVIMFASPCRAALAAADRNGQPPHHTIGVARINPNQAMDSPNGAGTEKPTLCPIGENNTTGTVSTSDTTKRRNMPATIAAP